MTSVVTAPPSTVVVTIDNNSNNNNSSCANYSWDIFQWIANVLFLPCKPMLPLLLPCNNNSTSCTSQQHQLQQRRQLVTLTLICSGGTNGKVRLCMQDHATGPPVVLLDLPITAAEAAVATRLTLECSRDGSGNDWPLLSSPAWCVFCNGRRVGFASRRVCSKEDAYVIEAVKTVTSGAGMLPRQQFLETNDVSRRRVMYVRGRFERVVGSADSESYHLVDPTGRPMGPDEELSFFFLRV